MQKWQQNALVNHGITIFYWGANPEVEGKIKKPDDFNQLHMKYIKVTLIIDIQMFQIHQTAIMDCNYMKNLAQICTNINNVHNYTCLFLYSTHPK